MIFDIEWRKSRNLLLILSFALRDKPFFEFRSVLLVASGRQSADLLGFITLCSHLDRFSQAFFLTNETLLFLALQGVSKVDVKSFVERKTDQLDLLSL